ncbi:MarR family winged helix-turn-helix transcriptional regulator [Plantactinospora sp. KLBMP9567]|uniref:MarR family winged helix-turn-helix transcriptional regulator n=1 Tax=Plantactinospora sp. KLBMP9567 TaxID=3085900 RepID=UPI002981FD33|nr:MarR family winged helix-turn-helix transcriptional regulator [Plantactinospora sp. KLBMP9567]MDW5324217.1 MarR family winged helix-turn-helix transcriptional regulator [Plantactinospora sp. KLBMP9567]
MDTTARHTELGDRLRDLMSAMRLIRHRRAIERPAVPSGLVGMLLQIDELADEAAGCHAKELVGRSGLDPSTVSRAVAALVARGLVTRRADPADRRASFLVLTDEGRTALADARDWYGDLLCAALADWSPAEIDALTSALDRFVTDIQGSLDRAPGQINPQGKLEAAR